MIREKICRARVMVTVSISAGLRKVAQANGRLIPREAVRVAHHGRSRRRHGNRGSPAGRKCRASCH